MCIVNSTSIALFLYFDKHLLSKIPAINKILMTEEVKQLLEEYPEVFVKDIVKKETENIKNEILNFFTPEENDIAYVYFYGGINDSAEVPIELFPLFIIKIKNISNWLELINKPNFYCLKFFSNKIDKVIDISLLDNEEDVLSISIGVNANK